MHESRSDNRASILAQRDAAMISLIAHGQTLITRLAMLTQAEKETVLALVVIGQSLASYAHAIRRDDEVIESFERTLEGLSPRSARRIMLHGHLYARQGQLSTCAHIVANDLSGNRIRHDSKPDMESEAMAEIVCHTLSLKALHAALVPTHQRLPKAGDATTQGGGGTK